MFLLYLNIRFFQVCFYRINKLGKQVDLPYGLFCLITNVAFYTYINGNKYNK